MNKKTILIVDDEPVDINIVASILNDEYNICVATSGLLALDIIDIEKPDLILLDVIMPQMNGYEVALKLKSNKKTADIPFIFLTAKNDTQSVVDGFNYGAVDYISKPFANEELLARVLIHLKMDELQKSLEISLETIQKNLKELEFNKKEFESIFNNSSNGIALTDLNTNFLMTNNAYSKIVGLSYEELKRVSCESLLYDENDKKIVRESIEAVLENGYITNIEKKCKVKDNKVVYVNTAISLMPDKQRLLFNSTDITELKKIQLKLEHTVDIMDKNIISSTTDLRGVITNVSTAFCEISGYSREELIGKKHNILKHPEVPKEIFTDLWEKIKKDGTWNGEIRNMRKDGSSYWAETMIISDYDELTNEKIGYTAIRHDSTSKKIIEGIAIRDELTTLYNRRYFNTIITDEINRAKRDKKVLSFSMMDVDYFKKYNDTYGHQQGDEVLSKIGEVLNSFTKRAGDFAFRLGGEEFGILFTGTSSDEALLFANSIKKAIEDLGILHIKNTASPVVTISAGLISIMPDEQISENEIYKRADELLYKAKENGRNIVVV